jgi:hypothetical protein
MKKYLVCVVAVFYPLLIDGQGIQPYPIDHAVYQQYEKEALRSGYNFHSFLQPGRLAANDTALYQQTKFFSRPVKTKGRSWLNRKLFHDNFFFVDSADYMITVDPIVDFQYGKANGKGYYTNTRGIRVEGRLGKNFFFHSSYYEDQASFPSYLDSYIRKWKVVPGSGSVRNYNGNGFDYEQAVGGFSWYPGKYYEISAGQGKHFLGDGYRSLILSDNAYSYPYLRLSANFWKIKYTVLYTMYQNMSSVFENTKSTVNETSGYQKKYGAYHILSVLLGKSVELSLFDAVVWNKQDSTYQRGFDWGYANPFIFYHSVNFSMSSPDNSMIGANLSIRISQKAVFYSQFILDDMDFAEERKASGAIRTKYGYQLGLKWYDALGIDGLFIRTEYNQVRPYVYASKYPEQNWAHYNQPLAHPQGANFKEFVGEWNYRYKRFEMGSHIVWCRYGDDANGSNWGHNIFLSDFKAQYGYPSEGNVIGQGVKSTLVYQNHYLSLCINPRTNLNLVAGVELRNLTQPSATNKTNFVYLALRSSLMRWYKDF